jgi:hypothetical protein
MTTATKALTTMRVLPAVAVGMAGIAAVVAVSGVAGAATSSARPSVVAGAGTLVAPGAPRLALSAVGDQTTARGAFVLQPSPRRFVIGAVVCENVQGNTATVVGRVTRSVGASSFAVGGYVTIAVRDGGVTGRDYANFSTANSVMPACAAPATVAPTYRVVAGNFVVRAT